MGKDAGNRYDDIKKNGTGEAESGSGMYSVVVLGGGRSSRMGKDKKQMDWYGRPLLEHILRGFPECDDLLLSTRDGALPLEAVGNVPGIRCVADEFPGCGPLAGMHAALKAMKRDVLVVVSCDAPLVDCRTAECLYGVLSGHDAVVPYDAEGKVYPLTAVYRGCILDRVTELLSTGEMRARSLLERIDTRYIPGSVLPFGDLTLANLNVPGDVERVRKEMEELTSEKVRQRISFRDAAKSTAWGKRQENE